MHHEPQTYADLQNTGNAQSQLVLLAIARHADWDTGSCFPAVRTLARMAKCSEKTVRRHLKRLAADGFVTVAPRRYEAGHQAPSLLTLAGYAEWVASVRAGGTVAPPRRARRYRDADLGADDDAPLDGSSDRSGDGPDDHAGSGQSDQGGLVNLTRGSGQQVSRGSGQQVSTQGIFTEPSLEQDSPLPHRCATGASDKSDLKVKGEALCRAAEEAGAPRRVIAHLLGPVLSERRFSAAGDKVAELVVLARAANDLPVLALERAARLLLESGVATIKAQRVRDAIAAAKAGGAMVVVRKGSAQWQRWVEHFERTKPTEAALMRRYDTWLVRAEWPPSFAGASRLASGDPGLRREAGTRGPEVSP